MDGFSSSGFEIAEYDGFKKELNSQANGDNLLCGEYPEIQIYELPITD